MTAISSSGLTKRFRGRQLAVDHPRGHLHSARGPAVVWAFARPVRKVYYNLTITGLSVFVAVFIGAVELLGLLAQDTNLNGSFWAFLETFNINTAGLFIVGVFVITWIVALGVWHFGRIEQKWESTRPLPADTSD